MDRREFLSGSLFAATAGLALDACAPESYGVIPVLIPEEPFVPGEETWLPSTCFECAAACGLRVRKIDGRLVKVEGNPEDPASRGGLCARAQALPQAMYHPDRIRSPLVREGERGSGAWKEASWDEALDRIASEMTQDRPFGFLTGEMNGHRAAIVRRFVSAMRGSHLVHEALTLGPIRRAHRIAAGHEALFDLDLSGASYAVSFGAEILESHLSPVRYARALSEMRHGRPGRRGKFVMVGPRLSLTAANADEWIPARPGAELDLALAVIAILLEENRHDEEFTRSSSSGLEELRALLAARAKPTDVADRTGIPLERIEKLARELAEHRPAVAIAGGPSLRSRRGIALALAVSHLNAILGNYRSSTLAGVEPPFAPWPALADDESPRSPSTLGHALSENGPLPPVLFIADTNPMHSLPTAFGLGEVLGRSSLIVSFASYPDETSRFADVILPESMAFERFEDAVPETGAGRARISGPLLLRPIYDTRSMPDALIALAKRLGRADAFPWESYEDALKEAWKPLGSWDDAISRGGFAGEADGGTWQFATPDRRYRFEARPIELALAESEAPGDFQLHVYPSTAFGDGRSAHLPFLQDLADPITGVRWGSVIEIAESDAERLGIRSGERIELRVGERTVVAPAHVSPGIHPGVVALAAGQGHAAYGRHAQGVGVNAYSLFERETDEDGFLMSASGVSIRKLGSAS